MRKNILKKSMAAALACCICGGVMPAAGVFKENNICFAASVVDLADIKYANHGTYIEILQNHKKELIGDLVIPEKIEGLPVTVIGEKAFNNCNKLTTITMPDTVTSIGEDSFAFCMNATSIKFSKNLKTIGDGAFMGIQKIKDITLPDKVETIGDHAFVLSSGIENVYLPKSVKSIGGNAFGTCNNLKTITIANKDCEFTGNPEWTICNDTVDGVGFYNGVICGVKGSTAEQYAKKYGYKFKEMAGSAQFEYVNHGTYIEIVKSEGADFSGALVIPQKIEGLPVTTIGDKAFEDCKNITSISMPDTVTSVGNYAFSNCENAASIKFSKNLKTAGRCSFQSCEKIKEIVLPDKLEIVSDNMFWLCSSLETVYVPKSVKKICGDAFNECPKLKSVTVANPDCEFHWSSFTISNKVGEDGGGSYSGVIYGVKGSTAEEFANNHKYTFKAISSSSESSVPVVNNATFGDVNGDESIDSSDASLVLVEYASLSTGSGSRFTPSMTAAADVNKDETVDSSDASLILGYYSYVSTGGKEKDMAKWIKNK